MVCLLAIPLISIFQISTEVGQVFQHLLVRFLPNERVYYGTIPDGEPDQDLRLKCEDAKRFHANTIPWGISCCSVSSRAAR